MKVIEGVAGELFRWEGDWSWRTQARLELLQTKAPSRLRSGSILQVHRHPPSSSRLGLQLRLHPQSSDLTTHSSTSSRPTCPARLLHPGERRLQASAGAPRSGAPGQKSEGYVHRTKAPRRLRLRLPSGFHVGFVQPSLFRSEGAAGPTPRRITRVALQERSQGAGFTFKGKAGSTELGLRRLRGLRRVAPGQTGAGFVQGTKAPVRARSSLRSELRLSNPSQGLRNGMHVVNSRSPLLLDLTTRSGVESSVRRQAGTLSVSEGGEPHGAA